MAATVAAVEQAVMERGLGETVHVYTGSAMPARQGATFDQTLARMLAVTRVYFQRELAAPVPPQYSGSGGGKPSLTFRRQP
jgi:hypothetical protein